MTSFSVIGPKNNERVLECSLDFSISEPTSIKKSINFSSPTTLYSNIDAQLDNPSQIEQVYTFGQSIPNRYVAVGRGTNNTLAYSSDGITWTGLGSIIFSFSGYGVAWIGSRWVALGEGTNTIAYSSDGITWTGIGQSIFSITGLGVAWNGGKGGVFINSNPLTSLDQFEVVAGNYNNNGYKNMTITIKN